MTRREFILLVGGAAAWPFAVQAQQASRSHRIGFLRVGPPPKRFIEGFRNGLREQKLIEGQNVVIAWGLAESVAQLPDALAELIRLE